ncbi:MAG TPA: nucleoside triphosphate pyrophosphohydrolase [Longimicrobiales bacterium]|nr:nucleoside triphosphate pyrophosphohydrolase [Longimicrobiales bacterium]
MNPKQSDALDRVTDLVRFLRTHCPWDARQTPRSLIPYLLEEAHETADAITEGDDEALRAELGDLLLNVAFQIVLAGERQAFGPDQVADTVIEKMRRRHPHLFGLGEKEDWETLKARERDDDHSILHGLPRGIDPLSRSHRIQDRVAAVGFDWDDASGAFEKVAEELDEVREAMAAAPPRPRRADAPAHEDAPADTSGARGNPQEALEEELGDLMFAVVNLARLSGANAFTALQAANTKFSRRFRALEQLAADRGLILGNVGLEALDVLWDEVKAAERASPDETPIEGPPGTREVPKG